MEKEGKNIGIALSGGGIRATVFHLGVLKWLAEKGQMESITKISTVSGGSLSIGLIYAHNDQRWPSSEEFLKEVLPKVRRVLLTEDIQLKALWKLVLSPWRWKQKVHVLADTMAQHWGIRGVMTDLGKEPQWYVNCTTFETGKRFRFCQEDMGDYKMGYSKKPKIPVAEAMAASAGFPVLVGPYRLNTEHYVWEKPRFEDSDWDIKDNKYVHLWDGGVYDNLGLESVFKIEEGGTLRKGIDHLIVSNAFAGNGYVKRKSDLAVKNLRRLLDIATDQVGALRTRSVMDFIFRTRKVFF